MREDTAELRVDGTIKYAWSHLISWSVPLDPAQRESLAKRMMAVTLGPYALAIFAHMLLQAVFLGTKYLLHFPPTLGALLLVVVVMAVGRHSSWRLALDVFVGVILLIVGLSIPIYGVDTPLLFAGLPFVGLIAVVRGPRVAAAFVVGLIVAGLIAVWVDARGLRPDIPRNPMWFWLVTGTLFAGMTWVFSVAPNQFLTRILLVTDIARARAQEAERHLEALFEQTSTGLVLVDAEGRIVRLNRRVSTLLAPGETPTGGDLGHTLHDASWWRDGEADRATQLLETALQGHRGRLELIRASPYDAILEATFAPYREVSGDVSHVLLELREVTELVRSRQEAEHSARMEALGRLCGGIAHEFNNMLSAVGTSAEVLEEELQDVAPDAADLVDVIRRATARSTDLTGKLQAFGRPRSGQLDLVLARLVRGALDHQTPPLPRDLVVKADLRSESYVRGDPAGLEAVVVHLLANAVEAMDEGGELEVQLRDQVLTEPIENPPFRVSAGPVVELSVRDTGQGMSAEVLARAFEPFFTTKARGAGTGLGLSAVHGTIRGHGGAVAIESTSGEGTTVRIVLPRVAGALAARPVQNRPVTPLFSARALLVDDEDLVRAATSRMLRSAGLEVVEAASGSEALVLADTATIDVAVLDIVMPQMNGFELALALRRKQPHLPILFVSGYAPADIGEGFTSHKVETLTKPFDRDQVLSALSALGLAQAGGVGMLKKPAPTTPPDGPG